jgi:hypothetical protein
MFLGAIPTLAAFAVILGAKVERAKRTPRIARSLAGSGALTGRAVVAEPT